MVRHSITKSIIIFPISIDYGCILILLQINCMMVNRFNTITFLCQDMDFRCHLLWSFYVQWFEVRSDCLFCWYWWNCKPSLL